MLRLRPESAGPRLQALRNAAEAEFRRGFRPVFPSEGDGSDGLLAIMRHGRRVDGAIYLAEARGGPRVFSWSSSNKVRQHGGGTLRWWDAASGAPIGEPMHHSREINHATYVVDAPGGPRVLSRSMNELRWWDAASGAPIGEPMQDNTY